MSRRGTPRVLSAPLSSRERAGRSPLVHARARRLQPGQGHGPRARDFLEEPAFARDVAFETEAFRRLADARPFARGLRIGPYRVLRPIAAGAMGIVLEALHAETGRAVALKVLRGGALAGRRRRALFRLQLSALERLRASPPHPGIVELLEAGETEEGAPWYSMELVHGVALERHLAAGTGAPLEGLALFVSLCDAVHHAHEHGVVHGDLGPANVLVVDGGRMSKVLDFGGLLAPREGASEPLLVGALAYAAPERLRSGGAARPTVASDVFSLGALLHEWLAGAPPHDFRELGLLASIRRAADEGIERPALRAGTPADLEELALAALDRDPARRPATAAALARAVEPHLLRSAPSALQDPPGRFFSGLGG